MKQLFLNETQIERYGTPTLHSVTFEWLCTVLLCKRVHRRCTHLLVKLGPKRLTLFWNLKVLDVSDKLACDTLRYCGMRETLSQVDLD